MENFFIRPVKAIQNSPGWFIHDGGTCPVKPDTYVGVPSGTYASLDGTELIRFRAGSHEWEDRKISAVRNQIQNFCVIALLPESDQEIIRQADERKRNG